MIDKSSKDVVFYHARIIIFFLLLSLPCFYVHFLRSFTMPFGFTFLISLPFSFLVLHFELCSWSCFNVHFFACFATMMYSWRALYECLNHIIKDEKKISAFHLWSFVYLNLARTSVEPNNTVMQMYGIVFKAVVTGLVMITLNHSTNDNGYQLKKWVIVHMTSII